jgi:hypothetical protein
MSPEERTGRDESGRDWLTSERPPDYTTERHLKDLVRDAAHERRFDKPQGDGAADPEPPSPDDPPAAA